MPPITCEKKQKMLNCVPQLCQGELLSKLFFFFICFAKPPIQCLISTCKVEVAACRYRNFLSLISIKSPYDVPNPYGGHANGHTLNFLVARLLKQSATYLTCLVCICIGGSKGGRQGRAPPPGGPNSFIFMQFSAKM